MNKKFILKDAYEHILLDEDINECEFNSRVQALRDSAAAMDVEMRTVSRGNTWQVLQLSHRDVLSLLLSSTPNRKYQGGN